MLNPIEPPWYVTRMPGGVTGTARESLPMSINVLGEKRGLPRLSQPNGYPISAGIDVTCFKQRT